MAMNAAPTAGALRRRPSWLGPTRRMSFAKIGKSAGTPPVAETTAFGCSVKWK
jgi:hypothetical protein